MFVSVGDRPVRRGENLPMLTSAGKCSDDDLGLSFDPSLYLPRLRRSLHRGSYTFGTAKTGRRKMRHLLLRNEQVGFQIPTYLHAYGTSEG